jgi:hypothetical protein
MLENTIVVLNRLLKEIGKAQLVEKIKTKSVFL